MVFESVKCIEFGNYMMYSGLHRNRFSITRHFVSSFRILFRFRMLTVMYMVHVYENVGENVEQSPVSHPQASTDVYSLEAIVVRLEG